MGMYTPLAGWHINFLSFSQTYSVDCRCVVSTPQTIFIGVSTSVQSKHVMKPLEWSAKFIGFLNNYLLEGSSQLPQKQWDLWAIHLFWRQVILPHQSLYNKHHSQNKIDLATLPHKLKQYKTLEVWANILGIWEDLYRYLEKHSCSMKLTAGPIWSWFSISNMVQLNRRKSFDNLRRPYTPGFPPKTVSGGTMVSGGKISAVHTWGGSWLYHMTSPTMTCDMFWRMKQ